MIFNGRLLFFAKMLLPESPDSVIIGYTSKEIEFCEGNEKQMWTYLVENKILFSTEGMQIRRFTEDAPFTKDFTKDSPGRAANYIGWKIVEDYYKNNQVSLKEIMEENDYRKIMKLSKYKP
jgi:hypothetical protein